MISICLLLLCAASAHEVSTVIAFKRKLDTCSANDFILSKGTVKVIWAYSDTLPGADGIPHRHTNRGSASLQLVGVPTQTPKLPANVVETDLRVTQVTIPKGTENGFDDDRTNYWCESFELPKTARKHHIIKAEPVFALGNKNRIHHILLYDCFRSFPASSVGKATPCHTRPMPEGFAACNGGQPILAWAVGGSPFFWPEEAGYPMNSDDGARYVLMEIHYDNPDGIPFEDTSGLRIWHTPDLRRYDAGVLTVGYAVVPTMVIPPRESEFEVLARCPSSCTDRMLSSNDNRYDTGLSVFSTLLHMHTAGKSISLNVIRNGSEAYSVAEPYYDFNFQENTPFTAPYPKLYKSDSLLTKCVYDSTLRSKDTIGGLSSSQEMCLAYLGYFPALPRNQSTCHTFHQNPDQDLVTPQNSKAKAYSWCANSGKPVKIEEPWTPLPQPTCVPRPSVAGDGEVQVGGGFNQSLYDHSMILDDNGKCSLHWSADEPNNEISFAIKAQTTGWVGLGFSTTGGMAGADIVMGWLGADGKAQVTDRFSTERSLPKVDETQNIYEVKLVQGTFDCGDSCHTPTEPEYKTAGGALDENLDFSWTFVDHDTLTIRAVLKKDAWLAIGMSKNGGMKDSTVAIAIPGGSAQQHDITDTEFEAIKLTPKPVMRDCSVTNEGGVTTLTFTIDLQKPPTYFNGRQGPTNLIYAYGSGRELDYHESKGSVRIDFSGDGRVSTPLGTKLILIHSILMLMAFGLVFPCGALLRFLPTATLAHKAHVICQVFATALMIAGFGAIFYETNLMGGRHFGDLHMRLGLAVCLFALGNALGGFLRPKKEAEGTPKSAARLVFEHVHANSGRAIVVLGATNIYFGHQKQLESAVPGKAVYLALTFAAVAAAAYAVLASLKHKRAKSLHFQNLEKEDL